MTQRDNILQELKELESRLITVSPLNVYAIPTGYFDELADKILNRIKAGESGNPRDEMNFLSPVLKDISKTNPYSVPQGYFAGLPEKLLALVTNSEKEQTPEEELNELSPLLRSLKKESPYKVPAGYFDNLQAVENKKTEAKVISIVHRKWFRYAAAAMVIGFVAISGFLIFNKKENIDPSEKSFAWVEKNMKKVSTDEIDQFIEMTDKMAPVVAVNTEKDDIKELIKNISDDEIQDFLNDTKAAEFDDMVADDAIFN